MMIELTKCKENEQSRTFDFISIDMNDELKVKWKITGIHEQYPDY